jgi:hypothetical protein
MKNNYTTEYDITVPHLKSEWNSSAAYSKKLGDFTYHYSRRALESLGLYSTNFCFFVLWNAKKTDGHLNREIWFKRELSIHGKGKINLADPLFAERFYENDPLPEVNRTLEFFQRYGLNGRYMLIKNLYGRHEVKENENVAVRIEVEPMTGQLWKERMTLEEMQRCLIEYSNGLFQIQKPLNWFETDLEHYLSMHSNQTGALFPGDCDMLLYDREYQCRFILEFKKCTSRGTILVEQQSFKNYISKDRSKYVRLNILRNYFSVLSGREIPMLNIFYPTTGENIIKVEEMTSDMAAGRSYVLPIASTPEENQRELLKLIAEHFSRG